MASRADAGATACARATTTTRDRTVACETCGAAPSKYTCPGCGTKTCGLACVKRHKSERGCDGKRSRTTFVDVRAFTDADIVRDYRFLEEVGAEGERAKRWRPTFGDEAEAEASGGGGGRGRGRGRGGRGGRANEAMHRERRVMDALRAKCAERGVALRFMANGMARRRTNTTYHHRKRDVVRWRVEWAFHIDGERIVRIDDVVDETTALRDVYAAHVKAMTLAVENKASMAPFRLSTLDAAEKDKDEDAAFRVLLEKFDTCANAKRWYAVDLDRDLASALTGTTVLEFPTFHVVPPSARDDYVVVHRPAPAVTAPPPPSRDANPHDTDT